MYWTVPKITQLVYRIQGRRILNKPHYEFARPTKN